MYQRRRRIETHRPRVQESQIKLRRIVHFQIRRRVRDQRKTPRVRFRKSIIRETLQIFAHLRRDLRRHARRDVFVRDHPLVQFRERAFEPLLLSDIPHRAAQFIRFTARVAAERHRDRHRLFLKNRNPLRALEDRLEQRMRVHRLFQPAPPVACMAARTSPESGRA